MRLFITHQSALEFWRSDYALYGTVIPCRVRNLDSAASLRRDLNAFDLDYDCFGDGPLDIVTSKICERTKSPRYRCHLWQGPIPSGAFVRIARDIYVATPELVFWQCARGRNSDVVQSALLGYELCGSYSLRPNAVDGFVQHEPFTSTTKIAEFARRAAAPKTPGRAISALRHVHDNAASPAESALALRLGLPLRLGGCSIGGMELNAEVPVVGLAEQLISSTRLYCDIFLRRQKIDIEYDSYSFHTGREKLAADSGRRDALASMGISVITVTPKQLYALDAFVAIGNHVRKLCGKRAFEQTYERRIAQDRLCELALPGYQRRYAG